jgi:hypothetical protein
MKNGITLNLTAKEAKVLKTIMWSIGGPPAGTRGLADSIGLKLSKQYTKFADAKVDLTYDPVLISKNSIYFKN